MEIRERQSRSSDYATRTCKKEIFKDIGRKLLRKIERVVVLMMETKIMEMRCNCYIRIRMSRDFE